MTDRPIIFSGLMVRALIDGRKTQTRRIVGQPIAAQEWYQRPDSGTWHMIDATPASARIVASVPYAPGDRLWVREAIDRTFEPGYELYRADYEAAHGDSGQGLGWRPSIHMPRWASRLTLIVTDVRVQRLQTINEADAVAEGCECDTDGWRDYQASATQCCATARDSYRTLWNSLHGPEAWDANPWVVALTFTVHRKNIDQMGAADA